LKTFEVFERLERRGQRLKVEVVDVDVEERLCNDHEPQFEAFDMARAIQL
jgi:hypothetical protein